MSEDPTAPFPKAPAAVTDAELLAAAHGAVDEAYVPYSGYPVGAALLTAEGHLFTGCNVEVANYSNTIHAEETAVSRAVAAGHRSFDRAAVTSAERDGVLPCGMCRQTLAEFCDDEFTVVCDAGDGGTVVYRLGDLLPDAITAADLDADRSRD